MKSHQSLFWFSITGPCEPALNETESCFIMETEMIFYLKGDVDSDAAAYASYTAIEEHMVQDKYIGIVPTILLLEYLSPSHWFLLRPQPSMALATMIVSAATLTHRFSIRPLQRPIGFQSPLGPLALVLPPLWVESFRCWCTVVTVANAVTYN